MRKITSLTHTSTRKKLMKKVIVFLGLVCHIHSFTMDTKNNMQQLCHAININNFKFVKKLVIESPSLITTYHRHETLCCILYPLSYTCRLYASFNDNLQPLHLAVASNNIQCVKLFLRRRANPNARTIGGLNQNLTPLHFATDPTIVTLLVKKGAIVDAQTTWGWTSLYQALLYEGREPNFILAQALLASGADVNQKCNERGDTLLYKAAGLSSMTSALNIVTFLLKHGANRTIQNSIGETPLDHAYRKNSGCETLIDLLK